MVLRNISSTSNAPTFVTNCAVSIHILKSIAKNVTLKKFLNTLLFDTIGSKNPNGIKHTTFPKRLIIVIFHP